MINIRVAKKIRLYSLVAIESSLEFIRGKFTSVIQFDFNPLRTIQHQRFSFESSKLHNPFNKLATRTQSFNNNYRIGRETRSTIRVSETRNDTDGLFCRLKRGKKARARVSRAREILK